MNLHGLRSGCFVVDRSILQSMLMKQILISLDVGASQKFGREFSVWIYSYFALWEYLIQLQHSYKVYRKYILPDTRQLFKRWAGTILLEMSRDGAELSLG